MNYPEANDKEGSDILRRSCKNRIPNKLYHIEDYVNFSCAFVPCKKFLTKIIAESIPKNTKEAMNGEKRMQDMNEGIKALEHKTTWMVTNLSKVEETFGCKWVYTIKY